MFLCDACVVAIKLVIFRLCGCELVVCCLCCSRRVVLLPVRRQYCSNLFRSVWRQACSFAACVAMVTACVFVLSLWGDKLVLVCLCL